MSNDLYKPINLDDFKYTPKRYGEALKPDSPQVMLEWLDFWKAQLERWEEPDELVYQALKNLINNYLIGQQAKKDG